MTGDVAALRISEAIAHARVFDARTRPARLVAVRIRLAYPAHRASTTANLTLAATAIRADAKPPCYVVGDDTTLLDWYSPCRALLRVPDDATVPVYVVRYAREPRIERCCLIFSLPGVVEVIRLQP